MTIDREDCKRAVMKFFEGINAGDMEAAADAFAEDATLWVPGSLPFSGTLHGRKAILEKNLIPSLKLSLPGTLRVEIRNTIAEGELVAAEWVTRRKTTSGRDYVNHFLGLFEVRDRKIKSLREYLEQVVARPFLGVADAPLEREGFELSVATFWRESGGFLPLFSAREPDR